MCDNCKLPGVDSASGAARLARLGSLAVCVGHAGHLRAGKAELSTCLYEGFTLH